MKRSTISLRVLAAFSLSLVSWGCGPSATRVEARPCPAPAAASENTPPPAAPSSMSSPSPPEPAPTVASPVEQLPLGPLSNSAIAALNAWAARSGWQAAPLRWSLAALPPAPGVATSADVTYRPKEGPTAATVTIVEDGYLDDSIRGRRYVLELTRESCDGCAEGAAAWTVRSGIVTQRRWTGRGHQDYSVEPCG